MKSPAIFLLLFFFPVLAFSQNENPWRKKAIGTYLPEDWKFNYCKLIIKANGKFKKKCHFFEGGSFTSSGKWFLNQDTLFLMYKKKWNDQDISKYLVGDSSLTVQLIFDKNGMVPYSDESVISKFKFVKCKD